MSEREHIWLLWEDFLTLSAESPATAKDSIDGIYGWGLASAVIPCKGKNWRVNFQTHRQYGWKPLTGNGKVKGFEVHKVSRTVEVWEEVG
jgi:hypothetical protein